MKATAKPTTEEAQAYRITSFRGIDVGLGEQDSGAAVSAKLEAQYPGHLVLVQAGGFLHGYDRAAHVLSVLKGYKLKLVGTTDDPHIRVGFPLKGFERRLWPLVAEFGMPYAIALGTKADGRDVFVSKHGNVKDSILMAATPDIVSQVIADLQQRDEVNKAAGKALLKNPDAAGFKLKSRAQELDMQLTQDILKMPRDLRATYGENLRACMARIMHAVFAYGLQVNKVDWLTKLSADIDLLKHYLCQAPKLPKLKFSFDHRAGLAEELGRLLGGVLRAARQA